jgi:adenylate kinase
MLGTVIKRMSADFARTNTANARILRALEEEHVQHRDAMNQTDTEEEQKKVIDFSARIRLEHELNDIYKEL